MPIDRTRDPESMTEAERRDEVASILARGLVRAVAASRARAGIRSDPAPTCLDLPGDTRLSVAPRPGG
jgi:hypothetical protein